MRGGCKRVTKPGREYVLIQRIKEKKNSGPPLGGQAVGSTWEAGTSEDGAPSAGAPRRELDVRPVLARGEEPLSVIMGAIEGLAGDEVLILRSPFDPQPLHAVLARREFSRKTPTLAATDFETEYWRRAPDHEGGALEVADTPPASAVPAIARVLDVRGLLPPEPLERTLAALKSMAAGEALLQINERVPAFLLRALDERGYSYRIDSDERGILVTIWQTS